MSFDSHYLKFLKFQKSFTHFLLFLLCMVFFQATAQAKAKTLTIAVIETDTQDQQINDQQNLFKNEIMALFEGERDVLFKPYKIKAGATPTQAKTLLDKAFSDKKSDMVLVLDVAANQSLGRLDSYSKITFLPFVFNAKLAALPLSGEASGKKNLHYLTFDYDFEEVLNNFKKVASFQHAALISDSSIRESLQSLAIDQAKAQARKAGVNLTIIPYKKDVSELLAMLPSNTDAVLYGFLPGATTQDSKALINSVNKRGLVSFSLTGEDYVRLGALATDSPATDGTKLARRTALHIEEVLLGTPASKLPVFFETSSRLMINMATSREIEVAPSFEVLSTALLINELDNNSKQSYSLTDVARLAVKENLSLAAQRLQAQSAAESVKELRAPLLPQINSSVQYSTRKNDSNQVLSGVLAENSTDGSITLTQSLFSEELWASFAIQKYTALSERELLREVELDITQAAVNAYLNVLREKTSLEQERYNLNITRENFRLAQNRVEVGTETAADLFRWESELANAQQGVLAAKASFEQQKQELNQLLNRPIKQDFKTTVETLDNPDLLISDKRITALIKNIYDLEALTDFFVDIGLQRSPELNQTQADINASERQLESDRRAYWLPDVEFTSEFTSNIDEDRADGGVEADDEDWSVGVQVSLPLFEGGARYARQAQSELAVRQSRTNFADLENQIEQDIRNNMEAAHASYNSIPLARKAEVAAQKNYELIVDSYTQGAKDITDVLDAQENLIDARESSMNAVYTFLIDLMNVQRAIGAYDFFLTDTQRMELSDELIERVTNVSLERDQKN